MNALHRIGVLVVLLTASQTAAQTGAQAAGVDSLAPAPPGVSYLGVTTDPPGAAIYLDSAFVGTSPVVVRLPDPVRPGAAGAPVLTIVGGAGDDWYAPVVTDTLTPADGRNAFTRRAGDTLLLHYALPLAARITSDPPGAGVLLGDSLLGNTPFFASLPGSVSAVRIRKEGYREEAVLIAPPTFNYRVTLVRLDSAAAGDVPALAGLTGEGNTKLLIAAGIAVASGTTSALLKHKADASYDDYLATGDPATLDRVRRLDISSALSLAVAQLAIGYLVIELLSR